MIKVIKGAEIYSPEFLGKKDLMIIGDKIAAIEDKISPEVFNIPINVEVIEANGTYIFPGFIDNHVHILGGGGEGGFKTRTPEIFLSHLTTAGITTVVGCLGTDGVTRSMDSLLAKARALEDEGITAYIYTGSYRLPPITITGDVMKDIITVDKVIGAGEIAISDHRSSQPRLEEIEKLASDIRVGGILSGKSGIIDVHLGDGEDMINKIINIVRTTEIPYTQFLPTHMNRNTNLFKQGLDYAKSGGYIDFTTSSDPVSREKGDIKASSALKAALDYGVPDNRLTFSSDGQGSLPVFNEKKEFVKLGIGRVSSLYREFRDAVLTDGVPLESAIKVITSNPAFLLKLNGKGHVCSNFDADLVIVDKQTLQIDTVIAKGKVMVKDGNAIVKGTFEDEIKL